MDSVVGFRETPRHVGVGPRAVAAFIDLLVLGVFVGIPLTVLYGERTRTTTVDTTGTTVMYSWEGNTKVFALFAMLAFAYYVIFEVLAGATVGKMIVNLRVVRLDGERLGLEAAIIRTLLRPIDAFPYFIPYLVGAVAIWGGDNRQRLGDRAAGTIVTFK